MRALFILVPLSLLLASCSEMAMPKLFTTSSHKVEVHQGNMILPEMREKIRVGMTRPQVRAVLGTPLVSDPFHANRWDYVYRHQQGGKLLEKQRLTLYFEDDHLVRIDDSGMPSPDAGQASSAAKN